MEPVYLLVFFSLKLFIIDKLLTSFAFLLFYLPKLVGTGGLLTYSSSPLKSKLDWGLFIFLPVSSLMMPISNKSFVFPMTASDGCGDSSPPVD